MVFLVHLWGYLIFFDKSNEIDQLWSTNIGTNIIDISLCNNNK